MEELTDAREKLFRSIRPDDIYWKDKEKKILSSAAFKDSNGLSVDRQYGRSEEDSIKEMQRKFIGTVVYVTVGDCREKDAVVDYCPTDDNDKHCEIIRSYERKMLSSSQARYLAGKAVIC